MADQRIMTEVKKSCFASLERSGIKASPKQESAKRDEILIWETALG
jgi:hypothetical protein